MADSVREAAAGPAFANYVGGNWQPANSGRTYDKHNPARPSELVGEFPASGEDDVNAAVEAAAAAFPGWSRLPAAARGAVLARAAGAVETRVDEIASDMTREIGKPLPEARLEAVRQPAFFRVFTSAAWLPQG